MKRHQRWKLNDGSGLKIDVLNNLEHKSDWNDFLREAFREWEGGSPNAVTLNMREEETYDPNCSVRPWAIKACNGNYGK